MAFSFLCQDLSSENPFLNVIIVAYYSLYIQNVYCFPIWSFSKLLHFCYLPQTVEPEGKKSVKMTRLSFLFSWNHIHIWLNVQKKNEMSLLLTSVPREKILAVSQNHPGTFPDQVYTTATSSCLEVPYYCKSRRRKRIERWIWKRQNSDWLHSPQATSFPKCLVVQALVTWHNTVFDRESLIVLELHAMTELGLHREWNLALTFKDVTI